MSGAPRVSDELLADLVDVLRGRAEVSRAFIAEEAGLRPTLTLELDRAPDEPAAYRELLQELFAEIAGGLGEHAHALSFAAGPPEAVAEAARGARVLYERDVRS
jgi:hypothetical protein